MAREHPRIRTRGNRREFVLVGDVEEGGETGVVFTQGDVRELQLAKAAIRSGIQALIEDAGCAEDDIDRVIIAGAFGTYISVASAVAAGMLPPLPLDRFHQVGNAAGLGARMALLSTRKRDEARAIAAQAGYIELASAPGFKETFVEASYLGRYHLKDGTRQQLD
jgi:uncharacterized 2Fe-2S/4Fe-4S cluster protein (DUF4445 family)